MVKYIYSDKNQAMLDRFDDHIIEFSNTVLIEIKRHYCQFSAIRPEQEMREAYLRHEGRISMLSKRAELESRMIPIRIEFS